MGGGQVRRTLLTDSSLFPLLSPAPRHPSMDGQALAAVSRAQARTFALSSPDASPPAHVLKSPQRHLTPPLGVSPLLTLRLAKAPGGPGSHLLFQVIQEITAPPRLHPVSRAPGRSSPTPPPWRESSKPSISANDGIVSLASPPKRSNLSSCSRSKLSGEATWGKQYLFKGNELFLLITLFFFIRIPIELFFLQKITLI